MKTRNKTKRNNNKKTQNKRRKSLFFRKVVGGDPTIKQIRPKKDDYKLMIIPCEDYDSSECTNKEAVLIQKKYFEDIKKFDAKSQHYMGLLMNKSDIVNPLRTEFKFLYGGMGQICPIPTCLVLRGLKLNRMFYLSQLKSHRYIKHMILKHFLDIFKWSQLILVINLYTIN